MGSDPPITVEITVSEEFRRLLNIMRGETIPSVPLIDPVKELPGHGDGATQNASQFASPWPMVTLRCDGQRPVRFRGVPILRQTCLTPLGRGAAEQQLSVYLAEGDLLYASLIFQPTQDACAHPSHHCAPIRNLQDFKAFLRGWHPEHSLETVFFQGAQNQKDHAAGLVAVRSSFNSMAADCICKGVLHS